MDCRRIMDYRCYRKFVYVLPPLICTQFYEVNTVFIFTLERRKIRQGVKVTCPRSHSSVEAAVECNYSDSKTQSDLASVEEMHLRGIFVWGHANSSGS